MTVDEVLAWLRARGVKRGDRVGLAVDAAAGLGLATSAGSVAVATTDAFGFIAAINEELGPRWVWWNAADARLLVTRGLIIDRCWDVLVVHRLLHGGWRTSIPIAWSAVRGLDADTAPTLGQLDLLGAPADEGSDLEDPVRPDGHIKPEWLEPAWRNTADRLAAWAAVTHQTAEAQASLLTQRPMPERALSTAHSESAAELLCVELERDGLPFDEVEARRIIGDAAGPPTSSYQEEDQQRAVRDALVFEAIAPLQPVNLRNPTEVKDLLRRLGIDLPDTRAWRLEQARDLHPIIDALLVWRKSERIATTYGYRWLDEHVSDGRLRGEWSSSDGSAGRMTASAGLHNLPSMMRPTIAADPEHVFVRADLGQIEPRVLAAVSGDPAFIAATHHDDLYQPVADRLKVPREVAKLAVLGAMYGATTGESAHALRGLQQSYPVAMGFLEDAAASGSAKQDVLTVGGRLVRMSGGASTDGDIDAARTAAASRSRYARNAVIQGAAAEFFKVWAILVRSRARAFGASVVLCLHDELLVHAPASKADEVSAVVGDAIGEAAHYWSPTPEARFLADISVIQRWSEAKG